MTAELISIIIPVYNVEKYLDRCIKSVFNQTYQETEIILVDDGSTDRSGELCDFYSESSRKVRVIHKENGGLSSARNAGIKVSTGSIICFIDSDDWVDSRFLELLYRVMINSHADAAGCGFTKTCEECDLEHIIDSPHVEFDKKIYSRDRAMDCLIGDRIKQVVWNKIYRRELISKIPFEEGRFHEDVFWSYQVFAGIQTYVEISYTGYYYFQRNDSIMGESYSLKRLDAVEAKCRRQEFLEANMPQHARAAKINLWFTCIYHGQQALKQLDKKDVQTVMEYLHRMMKLYPLGKQDYKKISLYQRFWLRMAMSQLEWTCTIRNLLKTGF